MVQLKDYIFYALMQILLWQILVKKSWNTNSIPQHGEDLGMIYLDYSLHGKDTLPLFLDHISALILHKR